MAGDGAQVKFDLGSSALLGAFAASNAPPEPERGAQRYDPVAELMASDTSDGEQSGGEHNDGEKSDRGHGGTGGQEGSGPQAPSPGTDGAQTATKAKGRRRLHASAFRLDKGARGASVVARMAPARRSRAIGDESSDSDSGARDAPPKPHRADPSPEPDSDQAMEDSANDAAPKKPRKAGGSAKADADSARGPRAASKAALEMIHRESERLVRETAVAVDPADFTKRLSLDDFFERYSARATSAPASQPPKRPAVPPLATKGTFAFSVGDGGAEVVVIEDSLSSQPQVAAPVLVRPARTAGPVGRVQERALDAILDYGSQPLHVSALRTGTQKTDGPLALKSLNSALLDLVYKRDAEAKAAQAEKRSRRQRGRASQPDPATHEPPAAHQESAGAQDVSEESDDGAYENRASEEYSGSDNDDDGNDDDDDNGDSDDGSADERAATNTAVRGRRRVAASSDEDNDSDGNDAGADAGPVHARPGGAGAASAASKAKFVSMFRMPVREAALEAGSSAAHSAGQRSGPAAAASPSQSGVELTQSQELPGLFTSQIGNLNTQDSLLLTPDNGGAPGGHEHGPDDDMLLSLGVPTQPTQHDVDAAGWTQSTQPMTQASSGTQLTVPTMATAEDSADASVLPSMVRNALGPASSASADGSDGEAAPSAGSPAQQQERGHADTPAASSPAHRQGRRLLRRPGGGDAHARTSRRRARQSEFVEVEAELGESSDSEGEPGAVKNRKFNWGDDETRAAKAVSDDEEEDDMDTDEEEAALLADPMIDNSAADDAEGNQAIRDLHRKRDFDEDEQNIQELFKDVTTGRLRSRGLRNRTGFALADDENYIDRQTRAERMEERLRLRRKLLAREIHDTNLAEIAKNPETAAFAHAALMRVPAAAAAQSDDTDAEDALLGDAGFDLEEEVDERSVAAAVQRHLVHGSRRADSDAESDAEDAQSAAGGRWAGSRIVGTSTSTSGQNTQAASDGLGDKDVMGGGTFDSVAIESLIVRRRPQAPGGMAADKPGTARLPPPPMPAAAATGSAQRPLLKRAGGTPTTGSPAKKFNMGSLQRAPP